jgi:hypothetical protein
MEGSSSSGLEVNAFIMMMEGKRQENKEQFLWQKGLNEKEFKFFSSFQDPEPSIKEFGIRFQNLGTQLFELSVNCKGLKIQPR